MSYVDDEGPASGASDTSIHPMRCRTVDEEMGRWRTEDLLNLTKYGRSYRHHLTRPGPDFCSLHGRKGKVYVLPSWGNVNTERRTTCQPLPLFNFPGSAFMHP